MDEHAQVYLSPNKCAKELDRNSFFFRLKQDICFYVVDVDTSCCEFDAKA